MGKWGIEKLISICDIQYGFAFDSKLFNNEQRGLPLIRIRDILRGSSETYTMQDCPNQYVISDGDLLVGMDGEFNIARWNGGKALLNQRVCKFVPRNRLNDTYLLYCMVNILKSIENQTSFVTVKHLSAKELNKVTLPLPPLDEQKCIAKNLDLASEIVKGYKEQLAELDKLVQSVFYDMFGDPVTNEKGWVMVGLSSIAEIKIGPFGSLLHKEDYVNGGHPLINPSHISGNSIIPDNNLTISEEKYMELASYQLQTHDIVLGRRGEMGRCAVVEKDGFFCGTGSLILRPGNEILSHFLQRIISYPTFKLNIENCAVGVTMMNLNVHTVSKLKIPRIPISLQTRFASIATEIEAQKSQVQQALTEAENLFNSLMQEYFE